MAKSQMIQSSPVSFAATELEVAAVVLDQQGHILGCESTGSLQWERWLVRSRGKYFWNALPVKSERRTVRQFFAAFQASATPATPEACCTFAARIVRGTPFRVRLSLRSLVLHEQPVFLGTLSTGKAQGQDPSGVKAEAGGSEDLLRGTSALAHELRNSLNLVLFSVSLLERYDRQWPDQKRHEHLQALQTDIEQMVDFLERLLAFGRERTAVSRLQVAPLAPAQVCSEVIERLYRCLDPLCNIQLVPPPPRLIAHLDAQLLQSILTNLLLNAVKYSPPGSTITLKLSLLPEGLGFEIKDEGSGIAAVDREHLFEPFFRGSNTAGLPGSGLGLTIVSHFVELLGGKIAVKSETGRGTSFTIVLPCRYEWEDTPFAPPSPLSTDQRLWPVEATQSFGCPPSLPPDLSQPKHLWSQAHEENSAH